MSQRNDQFTFNLGSAIIGVIGIIVGAVLGYLGTKASADAQIRAAQESANGQITAVWIQVYGPIYTTQTAEARATERVEVAAVTETLHPQLVEPESTSTQSFSNAIIVMNNFYEWINTARNKNDLLRSWNLETSGINGFQCREAAGCNFSNFQNTWWEQKIQYKLYDCGSNLVDAQLRYYKRDPLLASTPTAPIYLRYQLVDIDGELKINKAESINGPGAECELTISVP